MGRVTGSGLNISQLSALRAQRRDEAPRAITGGGLEDHVGLSHFMNVPTFEEYGFLRNACGQPQVMGGDHPGRALAGRPTSTSMTSPARP